VAVPGYEVFEVLGKGGMGVVYRARQLGLNRVVALKMILHTEQADEDQQRRFRIEAAAVARLQHPHVVQIHEVGQVSGRPYFSLEYCAGGSLEKELDGTPWEAKAAAQLVERLAEAVAAAHAAGIVHRDLKPANVLLSADGTPKVADFGLARRLDAQTQTKTGAVVGTPSYMAPEQAAGKAQEVGPAADVYALGAILYELLTGRPPFVAVHWMEVVRQVLQEEPVAVRRLQPEVPRDLETVCHKCLEKDPKRRYASAAALAEDLRRFVNDEPIKARHVGSVEKLGRWCRRNPAVAGLTAAVLLLMAVGTAVSTRQAVVANLARADLAAKNAELTEEQAKVQARFELARKAVALFHTGVSEDVLLKNPQLQELRTKLLKEAAGFYADLEKLLAGQTDAKSRQALAEGYVQLGDLTKDWGDMKQALAVQRKALALRRELAAAPGADVEARLEVASSLRAVASLLRNAGDRAGALSAFQEQRELAAALEAEAPTDAVRTQLADGHYGMGTVLLETGKPADALKEYQKARDIWQKLADRNPAVIELQLDLAQSHNDIGNLLVRTGKPEKALLASHKALAIYQKLADANPAVTAFQSYLAITHNLIGRLHAREKRFSEAFVALERGLAILQKLVDANASNTDFTSRLGDSHASRGWAHVRAGHSAEAAADLRRALALWEKAKTLDMDTRFERSRALALLAGLAADGKSGVTADEAAAFADQAVAALRDAVQADRGQHDELKEPDFDRLRGREDFKKLLGELEKKAGKEKPKYKTPGM
jgi:tetratricopeptide (TPR) repeat protein/tRNA A-37 threonylcarbamoyl transferase component Bud32